MKKLFAIGYLLMACASMRAADNALDREVFQLGAGNSSKNIVETFHDNGDGTWTRIIRLDGVGAVTIGAALPAGTNLIGKVGIDQTTPGTTNGVQVNAALPAGSNVIGKTSIDQTTPGTTNAVAEKAFTDASTLVGVRVASTNTDLSAVTITSIATVWTPTSGKKFRLMGGTISVSAAMNVLFEDNSAGGGNFVFRTPKLAADTPYTFVVLGGQGKISATANNVLKATGSATGTVTGTIYGTEE